MDTHPQDESSCNGHHKVGGLLLIETSNFTDI